MAELVDARDSKSRSRKGVRVQFPPWAPENNKLVMGKHLIVHYGELGLKGGNKGYFEDVLKRNLMRVLRDIGVKTQINYILGRFIVRIPAEFDEKVICEAVGLVAGIEYFLIAQMVELDFDKISKALVDSIARIKDGKYETFNVRIKKSQETLPFERLKSEKEFGAALLVNEIDLKVKMKEPDLPIIVECFADKAYIAFGKKPGLGGLPVGTGGKLLCLLSSGFDSPVAAFKMMRRGARVDFIHFSGQPYSKKDELNQVQKIAKILTKYQGESKLIVIPFGKIQKELSMNTGVPKKLLVVLYRRLMLKIAEKAAYRFRAKALITGESFGQVASQTLKNMVAIDRSIDFPVFRPLIGFDKREIIDESRKIGTHDISALPCTDTCSLFMPKSPEVAASLEEVLEAEKHIDIGGIIQESIDRQMDVQKLS